MKKDGEPSFFPSNSVDFVVPFAALRRRQCLTLFDFGSIHHLAVGVHYVVSARFGGGFAGIEFHAAFPPFLLAYSAVKSIDKQVPFYTKQSKEISYAHLSI